MCAKTNPVTSPLFHHVAQFHGSTIHGVLYVSGVLSPTIPDHIFTLLPQTLGQRNVIQRGSIKP